MSNANTEPQQQANKETSQPKPATQKIEQKVKDQDQEKEYKANLKELRRIVSQASPLYEEKQKSRVVKDKNGNDIDESFNEKVLTGYTYYSIDGKPIEDWIQKTFGGKVTLNKDTREISVNKEGEGKKEEAPAKE